MSKENDSSLVQELRHNNVELTLAYDATVEGFARALDLREGESTGHTRRVTDMTIALAKGMGIGEEDLIHIKRGALLHDIGKMGIPESILQKPGSLTAEEWVSMHMHPQFAYDLLSPIIYLYPALDIPYCHHEKWDGTGYPRNLNGELIPWAARIFAVVDVWDALTSHRPYREAWTEEKAREYIKSQSGLHFDPAIVKVFLNLDYRKRMTSPIVK
jgi:HD-GYP domain-containing protein (c-di-GMP phosphodiesterase class II)